MNTEIIGIFIRIMETIDHSQTRTLSVRDIKDFSITYVVIKNPWEHTSVSGG